MRLLILAAFWALLSTTLSVAQVHDPQSIPGELLVMLTPTGSAQKVADDLATLNGVANGLHVVQHVSVPMRAWSLHFDPSRVDQAVLLRAVRNHPHVQLAQNNHRLEFRAVPNDTEYAAQWHHANINSEGAWDISTGGLTADGDTIVVCIIENADLPHEDLIANAWFNHQEIPDNDIDDDANGYVDDFRGWNPNSGTDQVYGGGHGTEVAGMIGATGNNELGATGANWAVKMMVVFNSGASDAGVIASHSYPLTMRRLYNETNGEKGAFVVATNASWGIDGGQPDDAPLWCAMYDSLGAVGVLNCGATANNDVDVDEVGDLPTACPSDFMISVTATDINDERTFSAFGLTTIDVGAPGDDVFTTAINNNYGTTSGTSFASPLTAGVIGLLYSAPCPGMITLAKADPQAGALFIREKLFAGVDQVGNLPGNTVTGGRINASNSMELIMGACGSCPVPFNLGVQVIDINSTLLTWSSVAGTTYDLRYRLTNATEWSEITGITELGTPIAGIQTCQEYEFQVRVNCTEEVSDYSSSFVWTSEGCCTAPAGLTEGFVGDDIVNLFWNEVLAAGTYDVQYAPIGTSTFTVVVGITGETLGLAPLTPCTEYSVQVRSNCDGIPTAWSGAITVGTSGCGACTDLDYCATEGGDSDGEWIANVQLGTLDNSSGSDDGYGDYTTSSTTLMVGAAHDLYLEPGFSGLEFDERFRVWIDLDQNGELDDDSELLFDTIEASGDPVEGTITIPTTAVLGYTRMRVTMRFNTPATPACEPSFNYGEVEDYCVTLIANTGQSVDDIASIAGLSLFPQPADEQLLIRTDGSDLSGEFRLFDATGRLLLQQQLIGTQLVVRTAALSEGMYTYTITTVDGRHARGPLVVTHRR